MWVRFDDQFPIHRKTAGLSDAAFRLHVSAIFWCARNLTDGYLPEEDLEDVCARVRTPGRFAAECVTKGIWHPAGEPCKSGKCIAPVDNPGWVIHDYLEYQFSREQVTAQREANKDRQTRHRAKRNGVTNAVTNGVSNAPPVPSRPEDQSVVDLVNLSNGGKHARASPETITIITSEILAITGRTITPDWAQRIAAELLKDRTPAHPAAYIRQAIRNEPDPGKRFLPLY